MFFAIGYIVVWLLFITLIPFFILLAIDVFAFSFISKLFGKGIIAKIFAIVLSVVLIVLTCSGGYVSFNIVKDAVRDFGLL